MAFEVSHDPSAAIEPATLTVWPTTVVVLELKVTATLATGVAQPVAVVVKVETAEEALVDEEAAADDTDGMGVVLPEPVILISAHVR